MFKRCVFFIFCFCIFFVCFSRQNTFQDSLIKKKYFGIAPYESPCNFGIFYEQRAIEKKTGFEIQLAWHLPLNKPSVLSFSNYFDHWYFQGPHIKVFASFFNYNICTSIGGMIGYRFYTHQLIPTETGALISSSYSFPFYRSGKSEFAAVSFKREYFNDQGKLLRSFYWGIDTGVEYLTVKFIEAPHEPSVFDSKKNTYRYSTGLFLNLHIGFKIGMEIKRKSLE